MTNIEAKFCNFSNILSAINWFEIVFIQREYSHLVSTIFYLSHVIKLLI